MMRVLFEGGYYLKAGTINVTHVCIKRNGYLFGYLHMHV